MRRRVLSLILAASTILAGAAGLVGSTGCGVAPDAKSGGDAYRNEAKPLKLGKWVTDSISEDDGDQTDWKAFDLQAPGPVTVELHADNPEAVIQVRVFNRYGVPLAQATRKAGQAAASVHVDAKRASRYFVMVRQTDGPATPYTIRVSQGAGGGGIIRPEF